MQHSCSDGILIRVLLLRKLKDIIALIINTNFVLALFLMNVDTVSWSKFAKSNSWFLDNHLGIEKCCAFKLTIFLQHIHDMVEPQLQGLHSGFHAGR